MANPPTTVSDPPRLSWKRLSADRLQICLSGAWVHDLKQPGIGELEEVLRNSPRSCRVAFDCRELQAWDSSLLTFLLRLIRLGEGGGFAVVQEGLPEGVVKLLNLASAVPEKAVPIRASSAAAAPRERLRVLLECILAPPAIWPETMRSSVCS